MDRKLRILGWVYVAMGGLGIGLVVAVVAAAGLSFDPAYADEFGWIGGLMAAS